MSNSRAHEMALAAIPDVVEQQLELCNEETSLYEELPLLWLRAGRMETMLVTSKPGVMTVDQLLDQFLSGTNIASAASKWGSFTPSLKKELLMTFVSAAFLRRAAVPNWVSSSLFAAGCRTTAGSYSHTMARVIGPMILEANHLRCSDNVKATLGGRSQFTATRLTGKAKQIQLENSNRFSVQENNNYKKYFYFPLY
eukprot:GHVS01011918.1.p2 GENE.GHVS01011918.1~~GHVS01011918.1.p2  ORF type:complete len:197 (-),score=27.34 GHVS01011918.1:376-966(-)